MFSLSSSSSSLYVWAWTEEQKNKIMTANTSQELTQEEYLAAENKMYDVFDSLQTSEEIDEFDTCGFSAPEDGFKVLQCWEDKGHPVK